jgi:hypothetical protein
MSLFYQQLRDARRHSQRIFIDAVAADEVELVT